MKFYVKMGKKLQNIVIAGNDIEACVKTFKKYMKNEPIVGAALPTFFSVSQKGFDEHEDDQLYSVGGIIQIIAMSNAAKKELKRICKKGS